MKKALIVGVDYYRTFKRLAGCVKDAYSVSNVLERHSDGSLNFDVMLKVATDNNSVIERRSLKDNIQELFSDRSQIALLYFAGHGHIESTGGYLLTSECSDGDDGLAMDDILKIVNESPAENKIIVLDCCHSGAVGSSALTHNQALLADGVTILTASKSDQYSVETGEGGLFTSLFVDALNGSAANLVGDITPGSVYAHIDQSLGSWEQRPIFKTNVTRFISLRETQPPILLEDLRQITQFFPEPSHSFQLDPTFEATYSGADPTKTEIFAVLQKYCHVNLVKPIDEDHMYYAAMNSSGCKLTALGVHYWNLVSKSRI